ncbi:carbohydrate ABC transporter permease [Phycisphaera mikurensis]|uniref:Putative ABC transporter permease protein n=1 Tax=Phycisphaera mikurensis (strain NBRC 102666 / KCTC 22515 / FYK2301M01) TaxID=1142394 RepID=I0IBQ4_PHYMF|nr:sugar ABC transporter permease [Phycisphaera mikurensis]MBB6443388.1 ABC-type sugar transport system permease subunit [Phycisphaera mikurensis]BAM02692.1 putative ABC transporter permease protein [Phycisphaera mikurensis NBRC 102666]
MSEASPPGSAGGGPVAATPTAVGVAAEPAAAAAPARRSRSTAWAGYFFVAPFVLLFGVFILYPLASSLLLVTQQTSGPNDRVYVGLANFGWLLSDPEFHLAVKNSLLFTLGSVGLQIPAALGLAILLNRPGLRGRSVFRLIFFAPILVGLAFVAVLFSLIFEKNTGLLNILLHGLSDFVPGWTHSIEFPWLQEYGLWAIILAAFWLSTGYHMIYFLAALQNVSRDLLEAAEIDGAGAWSRFVHVTVPAIRPIATFIILLSFIGSVQLFELPFLLLGPGGGQEGRGLTVVMYLYNKGFDVGDLGMSSTVGWVISLFLLLAAAAQKLLGDAGGRR